MPETSSVEFCGASLLYKQGDNVFVKTCGSTVSSLYQCKRCGFRTFDPKPTADELNDHYQNAYPEASSQHYDFEVEYHRPDLPGVAQHLVDTVREFGCEAKKLEAHDYGCAMGNLVYALQQAGVNATGHDINRDWISQASQILGDSVSSQPFDEIFKGSTRRLHLVTMLHTLEHMPRPLDALIGVRNQLDRSGIVYICVPNSLFIVGDILGREADENFMYPTHLNYFSPTSMNCLLKAAGMRVLHIESRPSHLSAAGRESFLRAAHEAGFRDEEPVLLDKLSKQFRTAELFTIATRDDNPIPENQALKAKMAKVARFERGISASRGSLLSKLVRPFAGIFKTRGT